MDTDTDALLDSILTGNDVINDRFTAGSDGIIDEDEGLSARYHHHNHCCKQFIFLGISEILSQLRNFCQIALYTVLLLFWFMIIVKVWARTILKVKNLKLTYSGFNKTLTNQQELKCNLGFSY